ncbi:MAG: Crp/Fnr family transcriptional regulator [Rhodospirillum sp.]|nr:Crp/Fnr family transcriptional regulator [Rhodospirillum sp.]MCF8488918.1 Crp/Fnr family transcriptional regulator [Rhodospirillum sp.]MCF8498974.1 Crp/Fnr family transcriptional regulator [Rhodospirillum sp.]
MAPTPPALEAFPDLMALPERDRLALTRSMSAAHLPAGKAVFAEGMACEAFLMVAEGAVRVSKTSETGREIVLYRVERGQTCVLTTACLMNGEAYGAEGVAETAVEALVLPAGAFSRLMDSSPDFRRFVFSAYATRVSGLLMLIEEVAFGRIEARLARFLLSHDRDGTWEGTHQEMASELGTAREVVSRQLKDFERRALVTLGRGRVILRDRRALDALGS